MSSSSDALVILFWAIHLAPLLAPIAYVRAERMQRPSWQRFPLPAEPLEGSAYRSGGAVVTGYHERAPAIVQVAACSSLLFGAMFVPGIAWALFGLIAMGLGLIGIPGLIVAALLWKAGHALLRGTVESAHAAVTAAKPSIYLNLVILMGALVATVWLSGSSNVIFPLLAGAYAAASLVQAVVVVKAARAVARMDGEACELAIEARLPFFMRKLRPAVAAPAG